MRNLIHHHLFLGSKKSFDFSTNMVAYWKLSTNSNDSSGNGHNGIDTSMSYGSGYANFKPGYITIPDHNDFSFTDGIGNDIPFSILIPFYFEGSGNYQHMFGKRLDTLNNEYQLFKETGTIQLQLQKTNENNVRIQVGIPNTAYSIGSFHVGLYTYDGSKSRFGMFAYCDGIDVSVRAINGVYNGMTNTIGALKLGSYFSHSLGNMFDGKGKEWAVWKNRVITPEEAIELDYRVRNGIPLI